MEDNLARAEATYAVLVERFAIPNSALFYEHVEAGADDRECSYLWPYSGVVSALNALAALPEVGARYHAPLRDALKGLEAYYDGQADPPGYDSYIRAAGGGRKFYDDNEWLGLEFVQAYRTLGDPTYLARGEEMLRFALSGWSQAMGGGIYWRQHDDATKNTCSNGPAAVLALVLYQETGRQAYLDWAVRILEWLAPLKSPESGVYWDSLSKAGDVDKRTFTYNTGTPLHANALLYAVTGERRRLQEARALAAASYAHFAPLDPPSGERLFPDTPWFNAVLLRGYLALHAADPSHERTYVEAMARNLEHAWTHARAGDGTFSPDWSGRSGVTNGRRWLLDQAAMVELYARLSRVP
jgi:predicted outer membrane lipoprotein